MEDIKQALNKGGLNPMVVDEKNVNNPDEQILDDSDNEFKKKDKEEEEEKEEPKDGSAPENEDKEENDESSEDEDEDEKKKKTKHSLEVKETPEYLELMNQYNSLSEQVHALEEEITSLRKFKVAADRKIKEDMINNTFYMLSDADKADVVAHIDEYSLDQIEAKLAIICVRNKVNFNLDDDKSQEQNVPEHPVTYSLDENNNDGDGAPAWIKAVRETAKSL